MRPCNNNRKLIAWLALDELDTQQKAQLRAHLEECESCRAYFKELSELAGLLSKPKTELGAQASELFHQRLVSKLRRAEKESGPHSLVQQCRGALLDWRLALPAIGTALLVIVAAAAFLHPSHVSIPMPISREVVSAKPGRSEFEPSISNYKNIADHSLDRLEEVLSEQGSRNVAPTPIYTASALQLSTLTD